MRSKKKTYAAFLSTILGCFFAAKASGAEPLSITFDPPTVEPVIIDPPYIPPIKAPTPIDWSDVWQFKSLDREIYCMAKNIYYEGRHEPRDGQLAIGLVTINRVKSTFYPDSVCEVVYQKGKNRRGKLVAQFSWTLQVKNPKPKNQELWEQSLDIARELLGDGCLNSVDDFTLGATHYHATYVAPKWRKSLQKIGQYGLHIFYRDPYRTPIVIASN